MATGGGAEAALSAVLEAMSTANRRTLATMNSNYKEVLRAMRGELSKETKRLEAVFAANDARVVQLVNASTSRIQVRWTSRTCHIHHSSFWNIIKCLLNVSNF